MGDIKSYSTLMMNVLIIKIIIRRRHPVFAVPIVIVVVDFDILKYRNFFSSSELAGNENIQIKNSTTIHRRDDHHHDAHTTNKTTTAGIIKRTDIPIHTKLNIRNY